MKKLFNWFGKHVLPFSVLFLLFFIPLYPKVPLLDVVQTWVSVRLEDILIAGVAGVFVFTLIRQKQTVASPLTIPIIVYWGIGALVVILSIFFIDHQKHFVPHLAVLHYLRRVEYLILFFVAYYTAVKKPQMFRWAIWVLAATVALVIAYGVGQKFYGFPAFLTMNEEFAKGVPLRLPPTARIASTFGGHYDLAAYLVLVIPILGSLVFGLKQLWQKLVFFALAVGSLVMLLFTASRISFGVYLVAITTMLIWQRKKIFIIPVLVLSFILLNFVSSASERFYKTFRVSDVIVDLSTGQPIGTLDKLEGGSARVEQIESPAEEELPKGSAFINVPTQGTGESVKTIEVITSKDLATGSGEIATISGSFLIQKALVYDISITTRLQGQWPKAMQAFQSNPIFGSGFSTLSVASDGDYLRMLGETGIVGTIAFLGIFLVAFSVFFARRNEVAPLPQAFSIGLFAGIVGLFLNAILIDVFEASKVALTLWPLLGLGMAALVDNRPWKRSYLVALWRALTHPVMQVVYIFLVILILYESALKGYFLGDDFTWLRWAAESSYADIGRFFTDATSFFYRPIPKLLYFFLYQLFWLKPGMYHFVSLILFAVNAVLVYAIALRLRVRQVIAFLVTIGFSALSIHHENVYWISGQSSLLAGVTLSASILLFLTSWEKGGWKKTIFAAGGYVGLLLSMFSYDGMVAAPLVIVILNWWKTKRPAASGLTPLVLVPLYVLLRSWAHAIAPSGDYAYNLKLLPVNGVVNGIGYFLAIPFGPRVIEWLQVARESLRSMKQYGLVIGATGGILLAYLASRARKLFRTHSHWLVWFICSGITILAYVGLGGMAERYAYVASGLFCVGVAVVLETIWKSAKSAAPKAILLVVLVLFIGWNVLETKRVLGDWNYASRASERTLLALKRHFFPLHSNHRFIFIDPPIRHGRAWIFPAGLYDALWHMFKVNQYTYSVDIVHSQEEAFSFPIISGVANEVLYFEGDAVKRLTKEQVLQE